MAKFIIEGGIPLQGTIRISGSKNAALPILAATLLTSEICEIDEVPKIADVEVMLKILQTLGAEVKREGHKVTICTKKVKNYKIPYDLATQIRTSVLFIGPLLARFGKVETASPGGCLIGVRPIETHLKAFEKLGAKVTSTSQGYVISTKKLNGGEIILDEMSVTATENILMACSKIKKETKISLAACEPHAVDLTLFLQKMGVSIKGMGTHFLTIKGREKLHGATHKIIPDMIEAGTFVIAAAATKGDVIIENINPENLHIFLVKAKQAGVNFKILGNKLHIAKNNKFKAANIRTDIYPGFASDFQAPFAVLLSQAQGKSTIFETMYEGRLNYLSQLIKMGTRAKILDSHRAEIYGPTKLYSAKITSFDLRAGATLILAALIAQGRSEINQVETIDRGYENIEERFSALGAKIKRIED